MANDRILTALRELRALTTPEVDARRLLGIVASVTASAVATLRYSPGTEELRVTGSGDGLRAAHAAGEVVRLEHRFETHDGGAVLGVERVASSPFDAGDAAALELLGGEVVRSLEHARADLEAKRLRREMELTRALSRANAAAIHLPDLADLAARELRGAFPGAHVLVHVVVEQHLDLIARHQEGGSSLDDAPEWIRQLPLDGPSIMATAALEKQVVTRRVHELSPDRRAILEAIGVHHLLAVPLLFHGDVFGTLTVGHSRDVPWDEESLTLLEGAATQLSVELAHARLLDAERRRTEDLRLINELGGLLSQHLDLRTVLATAARALSRISEVPRVHLFLVDATTGMLTGVACTESTYCDIVLPMSESAAVSHAVHANEPVIIEDARSDPRANKMLVGQIGTRSLLAAPLVTRGEAIGAIVLVETRHMRKFTTTEVARVVAVANLVSPAIANAKMYDDLRQSYDALAHAQAELVTHERLAALGEFSAVIAHEVRNPVAIIFNSLGELRRLEPPTEDSAVLLDIVGEEAARLNRIVGDLLDFVRPYAAHPRHVETAAILNGAVDGARRAVGDVKVAIRTELSAAPAELFLDGTMLQQALLNLIVNAIQATPNGKTVTVRARAVVAGEQMTLCCEVADEGPGIDAAHSARVFQPFFTTKATGTGLGLALVRRLADALCGTVEVSSRPAGGTLFTLTVPLARADAES